MDARGHAGAESVGLPVGSVWQADEEIVDGDAPDAEEEALDGKEGARLKLVSVRLVKR